MITVIIVHKENAEKHFKQEEQKYEELHKFDPEETEIDDICLEMDFNEWKKTDQETYFEFFQLNKLGEYLTKEQRQRILDVAKIMFPNAEKGLYTEETAQNPED